MFPRRPERAANQKAPGQVVALRTNLYKIFLASGATVYQTNVNVDWAKENPDAELKNSASGDSNKPEAQPRKIGNQFRRLAVEMAISKWVKNNINSKERKFVFVIDSNGTIIYSLKPFFPKDSAKDASFPMHVSIEVESMVGRELIREEKAFIVRFINGETLQMDRLVQYCDRKISPSRDDLLPHIRALNVILRSKINTVEHMVVTPLNIFPYLQEGQFCKISPGVILNKGYSTSVRATEVGPVVNVANTVAPFHDTIRVTELLTTRFGVRDLNATLKKDKIEQLLKEIKTKQVEATHINYGKPNRPHYRKYRVTAISTNGAAYEKFTLVDKIKKTTRELSIAQYLLETYNVKLKYPNLNCIVDNGRKIPIELCIMVEKQRVLRKMLPMETAKIIKEAAVKPEVHFARIDQNVRELCRYKSTFNEFKFDFEPKPILVDGRELVPIRLIDGAKQPIQPRLGGYMSKGRFLKPATIKRWAICFLMDSAMKLEEAKNKGLLANRFRDFYVDNAIKKGIVIDKNFESRFLEMTSENESKKKIRDFFTEANKRKAEHIIFILPNECPDWTYRHLQYLEATTGAKTRPAGESCTRCSCVKFSNYVDKIMKDRQNGAMFLSNLWLKYNTKFGGVNFALCADNSLPFMRDGWIFVSVDVCHPAPGDKLSQSVAAVVGTWDITGPNMSHCTRLRVQKKVRENHSTIEDVGEVDKMVAEVLEAYRAKKKKLPTSIVILRDGVSEGQFKIVLEQEIGKIKAKLSQMYSNNKSAEPKLTCLVVQKRHKVRFIRQQPVINNGREDYNIQPGTVVDSKIIHPNDFAFYMAPHKAIQGTSKAPHTFIACDQNNMTQDQAQSMVHALSYLSPRCTKGTSIPTPINLADLAAEQGKHLVICWNDENTAKMSEDERLEKLNNFLSKIGDANYKNTLYYV